MKIVCRTFTAGLCIAATLSGCGNKGPLVLPRSTPPTDIPEIEPAASEALNAPASSEALSLPDPSLSFEEDPASTESDVSDLPDPPTDER